MESLVCVLGEIKSEGRGHLTLTEIRGSILIRGLIHFDVVDAFNDVSQTIPVEELVVTLAAGKIFFAHAPLLKGPESKILTQKDVEGGIDGFGDIVTYERYGVEAFEGHADLRCQKPLVGTSWWNLLVLARRGHAALTFADIRLIKAMSISAT